MIKIALLLATPLLLVACVGGGSAATSPAASADPSASQGSSAGPSTPGGRYAIATGQSDLVLRIATGGGFVAPGYLLTELPEFSLYGDGRIIIRGPIDEIYPSPLLPNLRVIQLTPADVQTILAAADGAGLLGADANFDATGIADAGTTVFTTVVAGKTHRISAYALFESAQAQDEATKAERVKLLAFQTKMNGLGAFLGRTVSEAGAYEPASMRVFTARAGDDPLPGSLTPQIVTWPLKSDPLNGAATRIQGTRCTLVTGTELESFMKVARGANMITRWTAPSGEFSVSVRPLLPDESGCPAATS